MTAQPMTYSRDEVEIVLTAPAFLGGADQAAEWRAPGVKALLRQSWRLLQAKAFSYDVGRLREAEAKLFGSASDGNARRSRLVIALGSWCAGTMQKWPKDPRVRHPEVGNPVGAHLYLGYGPLTYQRGNGTVFNQNQRQRRSALGVDQSATLRLRYPADLRDEVNRILHLAHIFGTLGGRSRNGWGSIEIRRDGKALPSLTDTATRRLLREVSRSWLDCLDCDWAHALGHDEKGFLVWETAPQTSWEGAAAQLAEAKIALRTQFPFRGKEVVEERHILAYPITHHGVPDWDRARARLANQLRFKVVKRDNNLVGLAFHLPCALPARLRAPGWTREKQGDVWRRVHRKLDEKMRRLAE